MQRRATSHASSAPTAVPVATPTNAPKPRRKVRRKGSSSVNMEEVQSLVVVALVTSLLTASVVWVGAKAYTALLFGKSSIMPHGGNHLQVHKRDVTGAKKTHHHHHPPVYGGGGDNKKEEKPQVTDDDYEVLEFNPIYQIPEAMEIMGDRSDEYATLRKEIDAVLPPDTTRSLQRVAELQAKYKPLKTRPMVLSTSHHSDEIGHAAATEERTYDIYNCPFEPPPGYPFEWNLHKDILGHWPVTEVDEIPDNSIHQGLCVFDYHNDWEKALKYRQAELPFIVVNDPDVARTVERWNIPGYMSQMLGQDVQHRVEYNTNSHFMYHNPPAAGVRRRRNKGNKNEDKGPPEDMHGRVAELQRKDVNPDMLRMTYDDWLKKANKTHVGFEEEHFYFRLIGCGFMGTEGECDAGSSE